MKMIDARIIITVATVAVSLCFAAPAKIAGRCSPQSTKPTFNESSNIGNLGDTFSNMLRAYLQQEVDGKTSYVPLKLITLYIDDHGESRTNKTAPHLFDCTLYTDCGLIDVQVTQVRPSGDIIFAFEQMQFDFGEDFEHCDMKLAASQEMGAHTYICTDDLNAEQAKKQTPFLVIHRMDLDQFIPVGPGKHNITWE